MYNLNKFVFQLKQCPAIYQKALAEQVIKDLIVSQDDSLLLLKAEKSQREKRYYEFTRLICDEISDFTLIELMLEALRRVLQVLEQGNTPKRVLPSFSYTNEKYSNQLGEVYEFVIDEVKNLRSPTPEQRLQWALFFCVCSGVCFPELLEELYQILITVKRPAQKIGTLSVIPINYHKKSHFCNVIDEGLLVSQRLFCPDPIAMAAIDAFLKVKNQSTPQYSLSVEVLNELFARIPCAKDIAKLGLKTLLKTFSAWLFRQPGVELKMWQRGYIEGSNQSASTSLNCLSSQTGQKIRQSQLKDLYVKAIAKSLTPKQKTSVTQILPSNIDEFLQTLRGLISSSGKSANSLNAALQQLLSKELPQSQKVLISWIIKKFDNKEWKRPSSAERYLSVLGKTWLANTADVQLENIDVDEITHLYEKMLNDKKSDDQKIYASLSSIILFMSEYLGTPVPDSFEGGHVGFVRTAIISEKHFQFLLNDIDKIFKSTNEHARLCIKMSLILSRRLGLRPHELDLQISDVEIAGSGKVCIRRDLKSPSSHRSLNIEPFLMENEFKSFCSFVNTRKHQARQSKHQSLFTLDPRFGESIDFQKLARICSELFIGYQGEPTPLYQLRHSAISFLQVVLFGDDEFIELLTPYSIDQARKIKSIMNAGEEQDLLFQLSSHAGHLDEKMSLSTYCHFSDILVYQQLRKLDRAFPNSFWCRLLDVRPSTLNKFMEQTPGQLCQKSYTPKQIETFIHHRAHSTNFLTTKRQGVDNMKNVILTEFKGPSPTLTDVDTILRTHDETPDPSSTQIELRVTATSQALGLEPRWGVDIIDSARVIKETLKYTTTKRKSRLYPDNGKRLAPSKPGWAADMDDVEMIENKLAEANFHERDEIRKSADMLFKRITHGRSEIIFNCPLELAEFLKGVRRLVPDDRWLVVLNPNTKKEITEQESSWRTECPSLKDMKIVTDGSVTDERCYPQGRLNLHFQHPHSSNMTFAASEIGKNSSNSLKYVLHLFAILLCAEKQHQISGI
jgi:hypothetical protein